MQTEFNSSQYEVYPDGIDRHFWMRARHNIIDRRLQKIAKKSVVLDIGCGRGVTVGDLRKRGLNAYGCDLGTPFPYAEGLNSYLFLGSDFQNLDESFRSEVEIVLLLDVLEHVDDPKDFLTKIRASFPKLKYIVITVPARQELWTNYDDYYGHLVRYTVGSFQSLIESLDLKILESRYIFQGLYLPMWIQAKILGRRNLQNHSQGKKPSKIHDYISKIFTAEEYFLPKWLPGSSIFAVVEIH